MFFACISLESEEKAHSVLPSYTVLNLNRRNKWFHLDLREPAEEPLYWHEWQAPNDLLSSQKSLIGVNSFPGAGCAPDSAICPDKHPSLHIVSFFLFFLCSWSSAENWERFSHETFMKPEKWKDQKFRGREDIHIHNPSQPFFNVSSCVLGCLNLIFPLIITPKWRIKSRNWRAAIPQWHFPPVLEACWYIAVVSVTCNVKQA